MVSARIIVAGWWLENFHEYRSWESTIIVMDWPKERLAE